MTSPSKHRDYFAALGEFVHEFASIEQTLTLTLWIRSGVSVDVARALFSGVKSDEMRQLIKRLLEAKQVAPETTKDFVEVLDRIGVISTFRNSLLHHPTQFRPGQMVSSNFLKALGQARLKEFPVSVDILQDLIHDLRKAGAHLARRMLDDAPDEVRRRFSDPLLDEAWRYRPPSR